MVVDQQQSATSEEQRRRKRLMIVSWCMLAVSAVLAAAGILGLARGAPDTFHNQHAREISSGVGLAFMSLFLMTFTKRNSDQVTPMAWVYLVVVLGAVVCGFVLRGNVFS